VIFQFQLIFTKKRTILVENWQTCMHTSFCEEVSVVICCVSSQN